MYIEEIEIKNFRGLNVNMSNLSKEFLIIGRNDAGKSNLCYAIRKLLDYDVRKISFTESDSTDSSKEGIYIRIKINLDNISKANRTIIGEYIDQEENDKESLTITFTAIYNGDTFNYDEEIIFGTDDKSQPFPTNKGNKLDKILQLIYVNPNYDFDKDKNYFFKNRQIKSIEKQESISGLIHESVKNLNDTISNDESLKKLETAINENEGFDSIFEGTVFGISSNIDLTNIYKSLDIVPLSSNKMKINIGDGKSKTMAMLLQKLAYEDDKEKIFIVEEPENHLYPLLQKYYASLVGKFNMSQVIYTSHSPYIIDIKKMNQIIKLCSFINNGIKKTTNYSLNINSNDYAKFGFLLNEEIAEMFFYDEVVLVEGDSEKYFYNSLTINDIGFQASLSKKNIGIFSVFGVDFGPAKEILESLGIKVYIKTDNDIFKVPKIDKKRYAGFDRTIDCLNEESKKEVIALLNCEKLDKETFRFDSSLNVSENIETKMLELIEIFKRNNVILSSHHDGFERDFLEFIGSKNIEEDIVYLQEAKMKNLHSYIIDNNIKIEINDSNKNSPLLRFLQ